MHAATITYLGHFHVERNHQGISNRPPTAGYEVGRTTGEIACREHLGRTLAVCRKMYNWVISKDLLGAYQCRSGASFLPRILTF